MQADSCQTLQSFVKKFLSRQLQIIIFILNFTSFLRSKYLRKEQHRKCMLQYHCANDPFLVGSVWHGGVQYTLDIPRLLSKEATGYNRWRSTTASKSQRRVCDEEGWRCNLNRSLEREFKIAGNEERESPFRCAGAEDCSKEYGRPNQEVEERRKERSNIYFVTLIAVYCFYLNFKEISVTFRRSITFLLRDKRWVDRYLSWRWVCKMFVQ